MSSDAGLRRTVTGIGRRLAPALALLVLAACGKDSKPPSSPGADPAPDFALADVNPNSATHARTVGPRQHLGRVSAWYFGHAT